MVFANATNSSEHFAPEIKDFTHVQDPASSYGELQPNSSSDQQPHAAGEADRNIAVVAGHVAVLVSRVLVTRRTAP